MDKKTQTLIRAYLEKAKEKLSAARSLLEAKAYDDVVSRAYYAAYHAAQAVLVTEGLSADTHQGLVNLFGLHFVKTGKIDRKFGRFLSDLKDDRENGDYEVFSTIDKTIAEQSVLEAEEFVKEMDKFIERILA